MIILPAIDIHNGQCVRLVKGDYATAHKVAEDPLQTALEFEKQGAKWLHMVDLDGAKDKALSNRSIFVDVAQNTRLQVEVGGGIRDLKSMEAYLSNGIARVILGSVALKKPALVREAVKEFGGERIVVGIDAREGLVATEGWLDTSDVPYTELAQKMEGSGVRCIIFTDIARDGTLQGPNLSQLKELQKTVSCEIIASGGIRGASDIEDLCAQGLYGAICGKSLYAGSLSLRRALEICAEREG